MNRLTRLAPRAILMASLVALAGTALADHYAGDAGTGSDAGNTQATAMPIAYGAYNGQLGPRDWDWFRVDSSSVGPRCVQVDATGDNNQTVRLTVDSPDRTRSVKGAYAGGGSKTLALAAPSVTRAYFDVTASANLPNSGDPARPGHYQFNLRETGVPAPSAGDALTGGDAGNSLDKATPANGACVGGRIDPVRNVGDLRDVYSITVGPNQAVTYSFAAGGDPGVLTVTLLDSAGNVVGPALASGEYANLAVPAGTYHLSVATSSIAIQDVGYIIGIIVGPPDPGNGCRPQC